jgi:hypothetical protein
MNDELERMWKEVVKAYFKELSQHLPGGLRKITKIISQDNQSLGQDFNGAPRGSVDG